MRRVVSLLLIALFPAIPVIAQSLTVAVSELGSGMPVQGAIVKIGTQGGQTDADGKITLSVNAYPATVEVAGTGYETAREKALKPGTLKIRLVVNRQMMQETIITGVPRPMKLQNALSNYTVINRTTIDGMGAITLADALPSQLNMSLNNDPLLGSGINMLGLNGDKVKILIDGMPVNGRENGNVDLNQINLNNIERIEIVKGPMSIVYGNDAMGGVINLITKKHKDRRDLDATVNYETTGKYNVNASGSYTHKRHQLTLGGGRNFFSGWGDLDTGMFHRRLLFKPKEQYLGNIGYNYTAASGFKLQVASNLLREKVTNRGEVSGYPYTATAVDEYYTTTRSNNRMSLQGKLGKEGLWNFQNGYAYYHRLRKTVVKDLTNLQEQLSPATGVQDTSVFNDFTFRSNYSNHYKRWRYDGGYDILLQSAHSEKFGSVRRHTQNNYAVYLNTSYSFFKDKLTTQLGVRGAYNTMFRSPVTVAANVLYNASEGWQIRGSYARAYRAPTLKEMYLEFIDINHHVIGNPDLTPEESDQLQASISHQYKFGNNASGQTVLSAFYNDIRNQITLIKADTIAISNNYTYGNIAHLRNYMITLQSDYGWRNLNFNAGISFTHIFDEPGAFQSFNMFEGNLNARYYFDQPKISFNIFYKYTGPSRQFSSMATDKQLYDTELKAYHMLNASVERTFWKKRLQLIAGVHNILDVRNNTGNTTVVATGHSSAGGSGFLPRSFFTTLHLMLN